MQVTDQDLQYFVTSIKSVSKYDFSEYSDKSLKRRLQKILEDYNFDLTNLITSIRVDKNFLEKIVKENQQKGVHENEKKEIKEAANLLRTGY